MTINADKTVRKMISLPKELAAEIDRFRVSAGIASDSVAIRKLIERGLKTLDNVEMLIERLARDYPEIGDRHDLPVSLLTHPLISTVSFDIESMDGPRVAAKLAHELGYIVFTKKSGWQRVDDIPDGLRNRYMSTD